MILAMTVVVMMKVTPMMTLMTIMIGDDDINDDDISNDDGKDTVSAFKSIESGMRKARYEEHSHKRFFVAVILHRALYL